MSIAHLDRFRARAAPMRETIAVVAAQRTTVRDRVMPGCQRVQLIDVAPETVYRTQSARAKDPFDLDDALDLGLVSRWGSAAAETGRVVTTVSSLRSGR